MIDRDKTASLHRAPSITPSTILRGTRLTHIDNDPFRPADLKSYDALEKNVKPAELPQPRSGLFIVFEGGDGSGKSTQAAFLHEQLVSWELPSVLTREPGDSALGIPVRTILLSQDEAPKDKMAETFLFMADRREHVTQLIIPALEAKKIVVCDRYTASTMAYQGYGNEQNLLQIAYLNTIASAGVTPDLTIYLNIDPEIGLERARRVERTRFEEKSLEYHHRVRDGFQHEMRKASAGTWVNIDARQSITTVRRMVLSSVFDLLLSRGYFTDNDVPTSQEPR